MDRDGLPAASNALPGSSGGAGAAGHAGAGTAPDAGAAGHAGAGTVPDAGADAPIAGGAGDAVGTDAGIDVPPDLILPPDVPPIVNLLVNPGFETGKFDPWATSGVAPTLLDVAARGGDHAVLLSGNDQWISQNVKPMLRPNVKYTFRVWVNVTAVSPQGQVDFGAPQFRISRFEDVGTTDFPNKRVQPEKALDLGWQELVVQYTFTEQELAANPRINVGVRHFGFSGNSMIDDFSVAAE